MSEKRTLLRNARALLGDTLAYDGQALDVLVEGERIAALAPAGTLSGAELEIDLSERLLVPGLVNGHQHSHEHFQRGRTENLPLELWMHLVRTRIPVALTPRQVYLRTMLGAIESLRTGCTTLVDDMALGGAIQRENIDAAMQAYEDAGIRALMGFAMMDKPIVDNFPFVQQHFPPELAAELRAAPRPAAQDCLDLVRELARDRHPQSRRVGVLVSASAPQRCSEPFLHQVRALADELALPVITHVQETRLQVVTAELFYGCPMVEYLDRIGFLKPATSLIHAVWLNPREIDALARSGATAQHNPWSNLLLGSGVQPVRELLDAGVNVSLGSDGSCSTVTVNMLNVLGSAAAVSKLRGDDFGRWLSAREALQAGTLAGGRALGFGESLGSLRVGAIADLVAYRTDTVTFAPLNDPLRQLVYAERGAGLDFSMVAGEVAIRAGRLTRIDEAALLREVADEFRELAGRYSEAEASVAPILEAVEAIYRRSLATAIAADTHTARLP
ncbi:amidohydrolase family protein [Xylophilus rhododendri]|uniref:Amidohydrolase family protein n=1 Tax=Xylophilus rhododendri TaxID=2697032 RepID=A0A857J3U4_9BURK|nr:amidohydrolase family protein [Xylophilus rhododendri]QHI97799.1 amidohydrolase family protein [Xylophilus rhododendri]